MYGIFFVRVSKTFLLETKLQPIVYSSSPSESLPRGLDFVRPGPNVLFQNAAPTTI